MNVAEQKSHNTSHGWKPINIAPKDKFVLLACPSGYMTTPWVFTTGILHSNYKVGRWVDRANDDLSDWGMSPIFWRDDIITPDSAAPAPAPAQEPARPQNCGTSYCSCIECVVEPAQEVPSDPNGWCQYVAGMVFGWLQMQEGLGLTFYDEDRFVEAIAGIIRRRLWAYKPAQEARLTDEEIDRVVLEAVGFEGYGCQAMNKADMRWVSRAIIAALRAKEGKL